MKFQLNYLMIKRLGEMAGLAYNDISPMNEIAPDTEELLNALPADALSETDSILKELGMADDTLQPTKAMGAFVKALFAPETCLRAELKEESGSADVYFIPFDGAWLINDGWYRHRSDPHRPQAEALRSHRGQQAASGSGRQFQD